MRTDRTRSRGFTLVEIMVVVAIIGLLAAIIVPNVVEHWGTAQRDTAKAEVAQIHSAAQSYWVRNSRVPTLQDLIDPPPELDGFTEIPKDPWRHPYVLRAGETSGSWEVLSVGPDGAEDTADDISSIGLRDR